MMTSQQACSHAGSLQCYLTRPASTGAHARRTEDPGPLRLARAHLQVCVSVDALLRHLRLRRSWSGHGLRLRRLGLCSLHSRLPSFCMSLLIPQLPSQCQSLLAGAQQTLSCDESEIPHSQ